MKTGLTTLGAVAACAACCVPLLLPILTAAAAGAGTGTLLFGLPSDSVVCATIAAGLAVGLTLWTRRRRRTARAGVCASACDVERCSRAARAGNRDPRVQAGS